MRKHTAERLVSFLTVKGVNKDISEPRRRLIRALTMDYIGWRPEEGYHFSAEEHNSSIYILVERVRKLGGGYSSFTVGITQLMD